MVTHKRTPLEAFNNAFGEGVAEWLREIAEEHLTDDELAILSDKNATREEHEAVGYTVTRELLTNGKILLTVYRKKTLNVTAQPTEARELFAIGTFKVKSDMSWELVSERRGKEMIDDSDRSY